MSFRILHHRHEPALAIVKAGGASRLVVRAERLGVSVRESGLDILPQPDWLDVTRQLLESGIVLITSASALHATEDLLPFANAAPLDEHYFLYADEHQLMILHHRIPSPEELRPDDDFGPLIERRIDRYGRLYSPAADGNLVMTQGPIEVVIDEPLTPISMLLLLSTGLTTPDRVIAAAGPWLFR